MQQMTVSQLLETIFLKGEGGDRNTFARNVISTFLAQGLALILTVATSAIIARWLGPEGKGILAMALLVPSMMAIFLNCGIGAANVYFVGSRRADIPTLTGNSMSFALLATILGMIITAALLSKGFLQMLLPGVPTWLVLIAMIGLPVGLISGYFIAILQGLQSIFTVNILNLGQNAFMVVSAFFLVACFEMGLLGALMAYVGTGLTALMILLLIMRKKGGAFLPKFSPPIMRLTVFFGLKGQLGNIIQFFNYRLDMFMVNYFLGPWDVGIYSTSVVLAELLWHFPNAVGFVIFPKAASTKPEVMNVFTPRVFRFTLGLTALGGIGLVLLGKPIISFIYSPTFLPAYVPLLALLPGVVLLGGAKVLTNEIAGRGYPHYNSMNAGFALLLTVILDLTLIPRYGALGAAIASSIAYAVVFFAAITFYWIVSRKREVAPVFEELKENGIYRTLTNQRRG